MSWNRSSSACAPALLPPSPGVIAGSARVLGRMRLGASATVAQGTVVRSLYDSVELGNHSVILENSVVIGPGGMVHGCHLGAGTIVEPAAIVCDWAMVGRNCLVRAGSIVVQRARFEDNTEIAGCLGEAVARVDAHQPLPSWALRREHLASLVRLR